MNTKHFFVVKKSSGMNIKRFSDEASAKAFAAKCIRRTMQSLSSASTQEAIFKKSNKSIKHGSKENLHSNQNPQ